MNRKLVVLLLIIMFVCIGCGSNKEIGNEVKTNYEIKLDGIDFTPGKIISASDFSLDYETSTVRSYDFEGNGIVYTFESYEIITNKDGKVYSVYFLDNKVATNEGIKISDKINDVKRVYGDNFIEDNQNDLIYNDGSVIMSFIYQDGIVTSISFTLVNK